MNALMLLPTRGCGLKFSGASSRWPSVAPHTGMWIEMYVATYLCSILKAGCSPHGDVD